jgi:hypothetical protein
MDYHTLHVGFWADLLDMEVLEGNPVPILATANLHEQLHSLLQIDFLSSRKKQSG